MTPGPKKIEPSPAATRTSDVLRANAANCAELAQAAAADGPTYRRYKWMEAAWLALAEDQDWLDGERPPVAPARSVSEIQSRGRLPARYSAGGLENMHVALPIARDVATSASGKSSPIAAVLT